MNAFIKGLTNSDMVWQGIKKNEARAAYFQRAINSGSGSAAHCAKMRDTHFDMAAQYRERYNQLVTPEQQAARRKAFLKMVGRTA